MKIHNDPQRSEAWYSRRRGIPTASNFDRIILASGKRSGQAKKYMYELAYEQISGKSTTRDLSNVPHIRHGIDNEDTAVAAFERHTGLKTGPVGFITNSAETVGCSPDRIILGGGAEALEIKCPTGPVMCGYLIDGMEDAYKAQTQGQMLLGGFRVIHFFAWSPDLPPFYTTLHPDPDFMGLLEKYLGEFVAELAKGVAHIRTLGHWPSNAPSAFPDDDGPDVTA